MEFNDIDIDIIHYATNGLDIDNIYDHYNVKREHYVPLLVLMPDKPQKRLDLHMFLELFETAIKNGEPNNRERKLRWAFTAEGVKYAIDYTCNLRHPIEPLENEDFDIQFKGIENTDLSMNVIKFLEHQCEEIINQ